jgi:hypothetical protein
LNFMILMFQTKKPVGIGSPIRPIYFGGIWWHFYTFELLANIIVLAMMIGNEFFYANLFRVKFLM